MNEPTAGEGAMKIKFEIKNYWTGKILFSLETDSIKDCLQKAVLSDADLSDADLSDAVTYVDVATKEQAIANLDKVREIILDNAERLKMDHWHADGKWRNRSCAEEMLCGTTHCLAGWLQVCSTNEKVRKLEASTAGVVMAPVAAKMFYRDNEEVLECLEKRKYAEEST